MTIEEKKAMQLEKTRAVFANSESTAAIRKTLKNEGEEPSYSFWLEKSVEVFRDNKEWFMDFAKS